MRYWWVNQNKTYRHEVPGGYLWSPKRKSNDQLNPYYEFMREVAPGDLIFSFAQTRLLAFGVASSFAYEAPKPEEFGSAGRIWNTIGWRVDVRFHEFAHPLRPADWIEDLRPLLPGRYSPLLPDGRGSQSLYLTELPEPLALRLADLVGDGVGALARSEAVREGLDAVPTAESLLWEDHLRKSIEADASLTETQRQTLVLARRGQGLFRERVHALETFCRVTRVDRAEHLRASHCKPWRVATNDERLDENNGLMLTPTIDHLFDRGFISFRDNGELLVSPVAHKPSLERMGVPTQRPVSSDRFRVSQRVFLEYHRDEVFLRSRLRTQAG